MLNNPHRRYALTNQVGDFTVVKLFNKPQQDYLALLIPELEYRVTDTLLVRRQVECLLGIAAQFLVDKGVLKRAVVSLGA